MGKHQRRLLKFAIDYAHGKGWHSMTDRDTAARKAMHDLCAMGFLEVRDHGQKHNRYQFRLALPKCEREAA